MEIRTIRQYAYEQNVVVTEHEYELVVYKQGNFQYAAQTSGDKDAEEIPGYISQLYAKEKTYRDAGLNAIQIQQAHKSASSLEIVGGLRSKMDVLLSDDHPPRGVLMDKAVRYLDTFRRQIFRYIENGRYSIDNNIAERYIRPLVGERKNSLFFGSEKMSRASAIHYTVISTCRMAGMSAIEYLRKFFRKVVEGERDYSRLMPQTIGINVKSF